MASQRNQSQDARAEEVQNLSDFQKVLLKGEPKVLGAVQLIIVFIHIALGTIIIRWGLYAIYTAYYGISLWGIPFFFISGSLSVAVERNPNPPISLVKAFQSMTIISAIESLGTVGIFCLDIYRCHVFINDYGSALTTLLTIILVFLILTNLLQFSICVSLSTFGRRALAVRHAPGQQALPAASVLPNPYTNARANTSPEPYGESNPYSQENRPNAQYIFPKVTAFPLEVNRFQPPTQAPMMGPTQSGLRRTPTLLQADYLVGTDSRMPSPVSIQLTTSQIEDIEKQIFETNRMGNR